MNLFHLRISGSQLSSIEEGDAIVEEETDIKELELQCKELKLDDSIDSPFISKKEAIIDENVKKIIDDPIESNDLTIEATEMHVDAETALSTETATESTTVSELTSKEKADKESVEEKETEIVIDEADVREYESLIEKYPNIKYYNKQVDKELR